MTSSLTNVDIKRYAIYRKEKNLKTGHKTDKNCPNYSNIRNKEISRVNRIRPESLTFVQLLEKRLFRIPPYQRAYSWQKNHRRDMFDDILRLRNKTDDQQHFMATMVGLNTGTVGILTDVYDRIDIVDGQQRLTTLIILLKIIQMELIDFLEDDETDIVSKEIEEETEKELKRLLIKQDDASLILLQTNHDETQYFAKFIRDGVIPNESQANTLADRELLRAFQECKSYVHNEWDNPIELLQILKNRLLFIFHQTHDQETVHTIFEVLNNRGLDVTALEILKNKLMEVVFTENQGNRDEHIRDEHIKELHQIWADFYRTVGLREEIPVDIDALGFGATLRSEKPPSKVLGDVMAVNQLMSEEHMNVSNTIEISNWLVKVANAANTLLSKMRPPMANIRQARLLAIAIILRDFSPEEERILLRQWEKTTFRIYGLCNNDSRTAVGGYVRLAWDIHNKPDLSSEYILKEIANIEKNHNSNHKYDLINMDCYSKWKDELRYLLYRYEEYLSRERGQKFTNDQWNRIWEASASNSIEHIIPQSKGSQQLYQEGVFVHQIGNLLLLPPGLNSKLRDKDPVDKVKAYRKTGLHIAVDVAESINNNEWSDEKIKKRGEEIQNWVIEEYGS